MEPIVVEGFEITVPEEQVKRLLTRKETSTPLRPRIERSLADTLVAARDLVAPRGIYAVGSGLELPDSRHFTAYDRMAFAVCTIGPALERAVAELSERGDVLGAVLLDAAGSVAAEAVADHVEELIAADAARDELKTSCRVSPGYGDWDIREQTAMFRLLPAARIGIELTRSCMMVPRKSVSFALEIAREPTLRRGEGSCKDCDRETCPYRHLS